MKMTNGTKSLLLFLLGILIGGGLFYAVAMPLNNDKKALDSEITGLEAKLQELQAKEANREQYIADTQKYKEELAKVLAKFPTSLNQELTIMFLQGIKDNNEFDIQSLTMGEREHFYTLGSQGGDGVLTDPAAAPADPAATGLVEGVDYGSGYQCYRAAFPMDYVGQYEDIKNVLDYVQAFKHRMVVNSISMSYDDSKEEYRGSVDLVSYDIEGDDRPAEDMQLNEIEIGTENLFQNGGAGTGETLNKYDDNDGALIQNTYDFYTMLHPASSDVSAKMVGQNGTDKDATIISDSQNTVSTLNYDFYEKDGKNYCKYTLDDAKSYEAEITSAEDVKLLIQSSVRKDDDDKAGVRIVIKNTMTLPVYVKVSGDDPTSPRVNIVSRTGAVKVY